ncbi:hypothetical protein CP335_14925 [Pseudomonas fluorescens]|uniref:Uncharacterized protein n=1 Tax=Pseudomonas fluorescens TaxID=294 RepID=A0A854X595_PSEFL|nr:hypothetical protein CP335_14925 [Pseudomonas fluorescens]
MITPGHCRSLWERACSRKRRVSRSIGWLTHRIREQARSHRGDGPVSSTRTDTAASTVRKLASARRS